MSKIVLWIIDFYQRYLTILSFGSCRYYPTCSSYAKTQFKYNNFFQALLLSTIRIIKCNPLFKGGFDYPKTKCVHKNIKKPKFKKIKVEYWKVPIEDGKCLLLKHNKKWD